MYNSDFCFDEVFDFFRLQAPVKYDKNSEKLILDVPGYSKEDIDLSIDGDLLVVKIKGANKSEKFKLNKDFKVKSAECKNGQLIISFEKVESQGVKIEIK